MRGNFEKAQRPLLAHEGNYSNHPNDPGGPTKYGITQRNLGIYLGRPASIAEVQNMTLETALAIYKPRYWDAVRGDELPGGLDYCVFDGAVNSGPAQSAKWLQRALKKRVLYAGMVDGIVGPTTVSGAVKAEKAGITDDLINDICDQRLAFMRSLRNWPSFKNGWTRRVKEVRAVSLKWDAAAEDVPLPTPRPSEPMGKAEPTETKTTETPAGDAATKEITLGGGGILAWLLSQFDQIGTAVSAFSGLPVDTAKFLIGALAALAMAALVSYGIFSLVNVFKRRRGGEMLEAE